MRTNTPAQIATRHMTRVAKRRLLAERIAADHAENIAHEQQFRATRELWQAADVAGLTPAEKHALDMELMHGADVAALLADLRQF